jgi:uncharacterized protein YdiU (UPF0061 family)
VCSSDLEIDPGLAFSDQVVELARLFRGRLTALVANWIRVGYCQGNFNSDNCAAGGYTLDYGPFGFCELFDPRFQPWTGGGEHFCFFNQPAAAEVNYGMLIKSLRPLLEGDNEALAQLERPLGPGNLFEGLPEDEQPYLEPLPATARDVHKAMAQAGAPMVPFKSGPTAAQRPSSCVARGTASRRKRRCTSASARASRRR